MLAVRKTLQGCFESAVQSQRRPPAQLTSAGGTAFQEQSVCAALPRASLLSPPVRLPRTSQTDLFFFVSIACICASEWANCDACRYCQTRRLPPFRTSNDIPVCASFVWGCEYSPRDGKGCCFGKKTPRLPLERSSISLAFGGSPSTVPSRLSLFRRVARKCTTLRVSLPSPPLPSCKYSACHAAEYRIFQCTSSRVTYMQNVLVIDE